MFPFSLARIEVLVVDHALRRDRIIVSSAGRHDSSHFLTVMVEDTNGVRGYGEAATTALWSGETAETGRHMVQEIFAPLLIGSEFSHPREALQRMDAVVYGNPFVKSALDTALWDVWARAHEMPATAIFADRELALSIPTRASVGAHPVAETVRIARELWEAGIKTLKFKIGVLGVNDRDRLRAVRDELGGAPVFTVDANGGYATVEAALKAIEELEPYNLALVEQPTPRERIDLLAQVKKRVSIPIMADECIFTPQQLEEALDCDAFDLLSIYPGKNGGFTRAVEMAQRAHEMGKPCAIGSNLETDLGQAAMAALGAGLNAFPSRNLAGDLPAALFYQSSSVCQPLTLEGGELSLPQGNGFGVIPRCFEEVEKGNEGEL